MAAVHAATVSRTNVFDGLPLVWRLSQFGKTPTQAVPIFYCLVKAKAVDAMVEEAIQVLVGRLTQPIAGHDRACGQ